MNSRVVKKIIGWCVAIASTGTVSSILGVSFVLYSCSDKLPVHKVKLGKIDKSIKGDIIENLPSLSSAQMELEVSRGGELSNILKWQHLDPVLDHIAGISADRVYSEINLSQKKSIIVAVIDTGVDIAHEDLKNRLWSNTDEIPNNGIDDDKNGYIDDVHGWNFLGHKSGKNITYDSLSETRMYKNLLDKSLNGEVLSKNEKRDFLKAREMVISGLEEYVPLYKKAGKDLDLFDAYKKKLKEDLGIKDIVSIADIAAIPENNTEYIEIKNDLLRIWDDYSEGIKGLLRTLKETNYYVNIGYNIHYTGRADIMGDDPSDFTVANYGNSDVVGSHPLHGTHVAGLIAAQRNNSLGMDGIAHNVQIMAIRAIPEGDERDKDVAMAIRYAADNGAHIINMSFGKNFSPYKEKVDEAIMYAAGKGILFFHSAGNSAINNDGGMVSFPNSYKKEGTGVLTLNTLPHWIEVGASSSFFNEELAADFSNYGPESVTLFAPGFRVYSTTPDNSYSALSGTSMAAPVAAGAAAMLMSEFEILSVSEVSKALTTTVTKVDDLYVELPGNSSERINFEDLSQTGGIINLYSAFKTAEQMSLNK